LHGIDADVLYCYILNSEYTKKNVVDDEVLCSFDIDFDREAYLNTVRYCIENNYDLDFVDVVSFKGEFLSSWNTKKMETFVDNVCGFRHRTQEKKIGF
jgi:hypothetical protein